MITPQQEQPALAEAMGVSAVFFKREDLHPYGSHKGRSIPVMIDHYRAQGRGEFVISSSGNAALAAALHTRAVNEHGGHITLDIFVGNHIDPHKLTKLKELATEEIRVLVRERPLQALTKATEEGACSLRQSTDDQALVGYGTLAQELAEIGKVGAVFMGTSSGTTAQALASYFLSQPQTSGTQMHIVQTSSCHPFSDEFEMASSPDEISLATAIVDKIARRKEALVPLIQKTGGYGWCATNEEIHAAQELVALHSNLTISANSALSVAGAMKAAYTGYEIQGAIVCMICGD